MGSGGLVSPSSGTVERLKAESVINSRGVQHSRRECGTSARPEHQDSKPCGTVLEQFWNSFGTVRWTAAVLKVAYLLDCTTLLERWNFWSLPSLISNKPSLLIASPLQPFQPFHRTIK